MLRQLPLYPSSEYLNYTVWKHLTTFNYIYHLYTVSLGSHFWSTSASPPLTSKQSHCCSPPLLFGQREDTHVLWIHAKRLSEFSSFVPPPWLFTHNYPKCTTSPSMQWVITSYEVIHRQWVNSSLFPYLFLTCICTEPYNCQQCQHDSNGHLKTWQNSLKTITGTQKMKMF